MKSFFDSLEVRPLRADSVRLLTAGAWHGRGISLTNWRRCSVIPILSDNRSHLISGAFGIQADNMLTGGGAREALQLLKERGHEYPDDPYLILMKGPLSCWSACMPKGSNGWSRDAGRINTFAAVSSIPVSS